MSNLHDAKPTKKFITLNDGVKREVKYTLNALAEIEDRFGSIDEAFQLLEEKNSIKAARCILWAGLIECSPELTEKDVGSLIDMRLLMSLMDTLADAIKGDTLTEEETKAIESADKQKEGTLHPLELQK